MYCTMVEMNQRQSKESLTANQLYMSSVSKQWATSQFWNLYCKAASPAKAIFNLLLGCGPQLFSFTQKPTRCYVKRQWRVCLVCDPTNMQFFLVQKARVRHCFLRGVWSFPYQDTLGRHGHHRTRMEWKTSKLRHTLHPTGERNVEMSCLLLSCGQYLTVTEQSVLYVVKKKERIYCPNKSKTGHLWEMCKVRTVKQENWWGRKPLAMLLE